MHGTYAGGGARVAQVADFQRDVLRNVVDDPVDAEKHSGGVAPLPDLAVYGQFEVKPLHVAAQLRERDEFGRQGRRVVEALGTLPGEPSGDRLALEVAGREVDAQSHFVVVTMRETLFDALAYPVDPHDQFAFVVHLLRERGDVKWVVIAQQRRIGLQKKYRFRRKSVGSACRIMQLLHMFGVITSYANYLHLFSILGGIFRPFSLIPTGKYIKYVPSGPRLVVSKPAPLKSKRVAGCGASFAPSRSSRLGNT